MTLFSFANCVKKDNVLKIFCYFPEKPFKNVAGEQQKKAEKEQQDYFVIFSIE